MLCVEVQRQIDTGILFCCLIGMRGAARWPTVVMSRFALATPLPPGMHSVCNVLSRLVFTVG